MKYLLLLVLFIFSGQIIYAQNLEISKSLSDSNFFKAKNNYSQIITTETYKMYRHKSFAFYKKLPHLNNFEYLKDEVGFEKWIITNISLTKFENVDEAIDMRKTILQLEAKLIDDNFETYELLKQASPEQLKIILKSELRPLELSYN